ncbi:MAG: HD-GYP domain-containing protein [Clostridia bacterium]|nr:HD-GYP domain-containing protein [Clostridia bacterium]
MRVVPLDARAAGRRLAKAVTLPDGRVLLRSGTELAPEYVALLRRRGFTHVYVRNEWLPDLPFDADLREEVRAQATAEVHHAVEAVRRGRLPDVGRVERAVERLLEEVRANHDLLFGLAVIRSTDDYTFTHSVNVAVLSLAVGVQSGLVPRRLIQLGAGALLHDVGKALVPREILLKPGPLSEEEMRVMREHTTLGFRALGTDAPHLSPLVRNVALSHHERLDGSGYPRGLREPEIHLFSKIVAVADVWDAMVARRAYQEGLPQVEAARELREGAGRLYDPAAVRRLLLRVAVFPTGAILRLDDGRIAVVSRQDPRDPGRPWATVVADARGAPLPQLEVRLGDDGPRPRSMLYELPEELRSALAAPAPQGSARPT